MDYKKELSQKIQNLLEKKWDVSKFKDEYYFYYINNVPDDALTPDEDLVFGDIQTKLDYITNKPGKDSQHGYITPEEYINWVKNKIEELPK